MTGTNAGQLKKRLAADHQRVGHRRSPTTAGPCRPTAPPRPSTSTIHGSGERVQAHRALEAVDRERRVRVPALCSRRRARSSQAR